VPARPDLKSIQNELAASLLSSDRAPDFVRVLTFIKGGKLSPERRLEIYRHNVSSTLTGALRDLFPVTEKIVSTPFFLRLAEQFVRVTPSVSGDLNMFGSEWPEFLRSHTEAINLPYLEDVAKLEWAWHQAFHAGDYAAFDLARLGLVPPDKHAALRFMLHPSAAFIASSHPIVRIWEVNQTDYVGDMKLDWTLPGDFALVSREDLEMKVQSLPRANFDFLRTLDSGESLEAAADAAFATDADFNLEAALLSAIQSNLIVDMKLPTSKSGD
jgi:Putative DNA-binding domain